MNNTKIYWASFEYTYNKNSPQFGKLIGGFVYGFAKAVDAIEALNKFKEELKNENLDVKAVEFISPYDINTKWETVEETKKYTELYKKAQSLKKALFDDFYAYENE